MKCKTLISLIVLMIISLFPLGLKPASADSDEPVSIGVLPNDVLFQVDNMKPGDWAPRTVEVQNTGRDAFQYNMVIQNDGEDKLYNELILEISDSQNNLYDGKLADFERLEPRDLASGEAEELELTIRFPEQLGNEFQGLNSEFSIIFTADGGQQSGEEAVQVDGVVGSDHTPSGDAASGASDSADAGGAALPDTATNIFFFLLIGAVLLVNGVLIYMFNKKRRSA